MVPIGDHACLVRPDEGIRDASRVRERILSAWRRAATSLLDAVTSAVVPLTPTSVA